MTKQEIIILKEKIEKLNSHRFVINAKNNIIKELQNNHKDITCELKVSYSWQISKPIKAYLSMWATPNNTVAMRCGFERSGYGKTVKSAINEILREFNEFYGLNASI